MPTFDIEAPNGRVLSIEAPDEANALAGARQWWSEQDATAKAAAPDGAMGAGSAGARGINKALTDTVGAPVDLVNWGLGKVRDMLPGDRVSSRKAADVVGDVAAGKAVEPTSGLSPDPFGGSRSVRRGLDMLGHALGLSDQGRMAYEDRSEIPRDMRWAASAGEAIGSAMPFVAGVGAAASGVNLATRAAPTLNPLRPLIEGAARSPTGYAAREAAVAGGAAQGAAVASALDPDSDVAPVVGQIVGSVMSPTALAGHMAGSLSDSARNLAGSFTKAGREGRAAQFIGKRLGEAGETADDILTRLNRPETVGAGFTPAERSSSPTLLGMEARAERESPDLAKLLASRREASDASLQRAAREDVAGSGDVGALTRAAEAEQSRTRQALDAVMSDAENRARQAADVCTRDPAAREAANLRARDILNEAHDAARGVERQLWGDLDLSTRVEPNGFRQAVRDIQGRMLPGEDLPQAVRGIADMAGRRGVRFAASSVQNTRSRLLDLARDASSGATPDRNAAGIYSRLADGLLDDLAPVQGSGDARAFSRALNDRWSRTFAGETQRTTGTGADKIAGSLTLERAMTGGGPDRSLKLGELRDATRPLAGRTADLSTDMAGAQDAYLRERVGALRGPAGAIEPDRARAFLNDQAELLQAFPGLRRDLEGAASARAGGLEQVAAADRTARALQRDSAFSRVLAAGELPSNAVRDALSGPRPQQSLSALSRLAQGGGSEAVAGLRSAAFDAVFQRAGSEAGKAGGFWQAVDAIAHQPLGPSRGSLMQAMREGGIVNTTQRARFKQIVDRGVRQEQAASLGRDIDTLGPVSDDGWDFLLRVAGANYGSSVSIAGSHSGAPLVAAGYGSKLFQKVFQKVPSQKVADVIKQALGDEDLMKTLLTKVNSPGAERLVRSKLSGALLGAGERATRDR